MLEQCHAQIALICPVTTLAQVVVVKLKEVVEKVSRYFILRMWRYRRTCLIRRCLDSEDGDTPPRDTLPVHRDEQCPGGEYLRRRVVQSRLRYSFLCGDDIAIIDLRSLYPRDRTTRPIVADLPTWRPA